MAKTDKKEQAYDLFMRGSKQNEIAQLVGVTEKTVGRWVEAGKWKEARESLLDTRSKTIELLQSVVRQLSQKAKEDIDSGGTKHASYADSITKHTHSIARLEKETGIGDMIQTGMEFLSFLKDNDLEAAQLLNKWFLVFIQGKLNK